MQRRTGTLYPQFAGRPASRALSSGSMAVWPIRNQLLSANRKHVHLRSADDEAEVLKETTDLVFKITLDLDEQGPARQQGLDCMAIEGLHTDLLIPAALHDACDPRGVVTLALVNLHFSGLPSHAGHQCR